MSTSKNFAILLLAGSSSRFGGHTPKIFLEVDNKPLFIYPLEVLDNNSNIDEIILVTKNELISQIKQDLQRFSIKKVTKIVLGGETRSESVKNGIDSLESSTTNIVLICDGDRPNLTDRIISENINAAKNADGAVTAVKSIDSTFLLKGGIEYLDRNNLWNAQTPQTFKINVIKDAFSKINFNNFTDDASIVRKLGYNIAVVEGDYSNFKITTKTDFDRFVAEKKL